MQKTFYIRRSVLVDGMTVPSIDRFARMEKLDQLVASGWVIKEFRSEPEEEYFVLEKDS